MEGKIKAQDLRLGNIVKTKLGTVVKVEAIGQNGGWIQVYHEIAREEIDSDIHELQPIELTEEWLIKLGFEWHKSDDYIFKGPISFVESKRFNCFDSFVCKSDDCIHGPNIQYVHQLQNLYFALTGKELPGEI